MWLASGLQRLKSFFDGAPQAAPAGAGHGADWADGGNDGWTADWVPDRPRRRLTADSLAGAPNAARATAHVMEGASRGGSASRPRPQTDAPTTSNRETRDKQGRSDMDIQGQGSLAAEGRMNGAAAHGAFAALPEDNDAPVQLQRLAGEDMVRRSPAPSRSAEPAIALAAAPGGGGKGTGGLGAGIGGNGLGDGGGDGTGDDPPAPPAPSGGSTSALNQQVVQAVQFSNTENLAYGMKMAVTPPEIMVGQTTGQAVQDAASYMNAIMQIAVAAQAIAIKKAAQGPVGEAEAVPLLAEIQSMVTAAVQVYGSVSTTAGQSAQTIFSDLKTP